MLQRLPIELFCTVLRYLPYDDLEELHKIPLFEPVVRHHLLRHYRFHYQVSSLLRIFESMLPSDEDQRGDIADQLLELICHVVEKCPNYEHRNKFTDLLTILENIVVKRVLAIDLKPSGENDYAILCLDIRYKYLHQPSIRALHDPKYRRRSTKYPLAPFLPREYTWVWRRQCAGVTRFLNSKRTPLSLNDKDRRQRLRFARFFGQLFKVTSLYLESNLDGTFEECVREALVAGDVESLLAMCATAERPVDVMHMCMSVNLQLEQLWSYIESLDDWIATDPTPEQRARIAQNEQQQQRQEDFPPEWVLPDRYKITDDTKLRLTLMDNLYKQGWRWFD
ncbi:hypothetical protein BJV82DRAFT_628240 [Fennellomyces sp. T-0311]|nr:hypothetical protein BJV82DRAFT_628240 [Fennellomyces sp. T-0311]